MIVQGLAELKLYPVADRGVPNKERVAVQANVTTDVSQFGLMVGVSQTDGGTLPARDNLFWFGNGVIDAGDWVVVYTGGGEPKTQDWHNPPGSKVYVVHWGRSSTMFAHSSIVPILFKTEALCIDKPPTDLPQLSQ